MSLHPFDPRADRPLTPLFLSGGGELGELIRELDWSSTPLGPPETWPQSLKTALRIMLTSRQPIWIGWGRELIYFYNDAYKSIIGGKHPWALGRPTSEVWREIWGDIGPMLAQAMRGDEGTYVEEQLLLMERSGYPEETYYTFSYSPIPDDDGSAGGIICANTDDTKRVIGERQLATLRDLAAETVDSRTWRDVCERGVKALHKNARDILFAALYIGDDKGGPLSLASSAGITAGHVAAPALIASSSLWQAGLTAPEHEPWRVRDLPDLFHGEMPTGAWQQPARQAAVLPLPTAGDNSRSGLLVVGLNPFRQFDDSYSGFLALVAGQLSAAIANADAYEAERGRAEALSEIDQAKTVFFSNISHEFRTPLTLMLGPLEEVLAKSDLELKPDSRRLIEVVHRNGLRLTKLVNTLLDFSRLEAGRVQANYRPTDLATYTVELASSFRSAVEKADLSFQVDIEQLREPVFIDHDMWEKIVLNLLSNAFKFTFTGTIGIKLRQNSGSAWLTVSDTGIGVSAENLPRLFERFHRIEGARGRSFEGSGIGLALVDELVRLHGGTVTVESELDHGTTFTVMIPLGSAHLPFERVETVSGSVVSSTRVDAYVEEATRWLPYDDLPSLGGADMTAGSILDAGVAFEQNRPRVLLADDNNDMREYIRRLLAGRYDVEVVGDGEAALKAIRSKRPDLLLTDVMMPKLDGFGLLEALRGDDTLRDLPVLMLSARAGEEAQIEGLGAGADDYLVKPFSARELVARVSANLELARTRRIAAVALEQLNETLASESDRLSRMFEQAPTIMAMLRGPDHVVEMANPAYLQLVGHREVIGQTVAAALPEVVEQGYVELLDRVYCTGEAFVGDALKVRLQRFAGAPLEDRFVDFVYQPIVGRNGSVSGIFVQGSDVTERARAEALRSAQNRVLELTLQDAPLGEALEQLVATVEVAAASGMIGSILLADETGTHLLHGAAPGLPDAYNAAIDGIEIALNVGSCGTAAYLKVPVYASNIAIDPLWAAYRDLALSHGLRACWSTPILSAAGTLLGTFAMYYRESREPVAADLEVVEVVTRTAALLIERKRAEQALHASQSELREANETLEQRVEDRTRALQSAQEQLRQSQKLEAMGQLTGGVAHDFNNLLSPIVGGLDILQRLASDGSRERRLIDGALQSAERARTLVQRLLAFARRQPLQSEAVNIDALVRGMADLVSSTTGPNVKVVVAIADGLPPAIADANQLEMAMLNLSVNARDAMPNGGTLTISAALEVVADGHRSKLAPGRYITLSVTDTGEGMDEATIARAIEPFFSTKGIGQGTGLGLSMVHGLASQLGGALTITSELGAGTSIDLFLPVSNEPARPAPVGKVIATSTGGNRGQILLVDDEDLVRASTAEMLTDLGFQVFEAASAHQALTAIQAGLGVDLIVTDHLMPGMTGVELAQREAARPGGVPVLIISGYGDADPLGSGFPRLTKPFRQAELSEALNDLISRSGLT